MIRIEKKLFESSLKTFDHRGAKLIRGSQKKHSGPRPLDYNYNGRPLIEIQSIWNPKEAFSSYIQYNNRQIIAHHQCVIHPCKHTCSPQCKYSTSIWLVLTHCFTLNRIQQVRNFILISLCDINVIEMTKMCKKSKWLFWRAILDIFSRKPFWFIVENHLEKKYPTKSVFFF